MSHSDLFIKKFIQKVRRRMTEQKVLRYGMYGALAGFTLATIISVIALMVPWYYAPLIASIGAAVGVIAGITLGIVRRPSMEKAALGLDAHGFQERLITSYQLAGREDPFSQMQKADTIRRVNQFQIRKTFPLKVRWQLLLAMLGTAAAFVIISFIPTAAKTQAQEYHEIARQADEDIRKVEDAIEHVEKMEDLSETEKETLLSSLEEAKKELQEVSNADDLAKARERLTVKMTQEANQAEKRKVREELQTLSNALREEPKSEEEQLAEDLADLQKDLQNLNENTSAEDRQAIAGEMQRLGQMTGNQTMKDGAAGIQNNTASSEQLQNLQQAVSGEQQQAQANAQQASNGSNNQQGQNNQSSQNNQTAQNTPNGQNNQNNQNGQNTQNGQNNQQAQSNPNGQNASGNQGSQSGQNNQSGLNGNGGQSGQGSGNGSGQSQAGQGGGYNTGSNVGTEKDPSLTGQMITIPNRELQDNENLDGKINTAGSGTTQRGGEAWAGTSVDYQQVIGNYTQNAYNKVENSNYPSGVQDIVKSYFDDLNK